MATAILILALAVTAWLASLYVRPFGRCLRCRGRRVIIGARGRPRPCPSCGATGQQQRLGSRTLHRTVRIVRAELARTRRERGTR
jgi:hypothetical protein